MNKKKAIWIFTIIVALSGLGLGMSDSLLSNYFRDAFEVTAFQRGIIELPREAPGILILFIVSGLAFLGDKKLTIIAHVLSAIGIFALGILSPSFNVMLVFLFIFSLGVHMFIPLYDSLGLSLAQDGNYGRVLGRFNATRTAFSLLAGVLVFIGFRSGFFSFTTPRIVNFIFAGVFFIAIAVLMVYLLKLNGDNPSKARIVLRKEYGKFYVMASLFGGRKQIIFVYGPWVLIELFNFSADSMALLIIAGSAISIFFIPILGRLIDKYGAVKMMIVEVVTFFVLYLGYGLISASVYGGWLFSMGLGVAIAIAINLLDRVVFNFNMARSVYVRSIARDPADVTPTLATGLALDHVFSIICSILCGWIWVQFGPHYVFVFSGVLAVLQLLVTLSARSQLGDTQNGKEC